MTSLTEEQELLAYLNANGASSPKVVPGKNEVTFLSKETGIPQVWKWKQGNKITQYSHLNDRVMSVHHSPSGKQTIIGMDSKGNEKQQLFLLTEDGANVEELVVSEDHFHRFGGWSPSEEKIAFASNRRHPGYFDVYVFDMNSKQAEVVYEFDGSCTPICWTKDGEGLLLRLIETNIDQSLYLFDLHTKQMTKLGVRGTNGRYPAIELLKNGDGGYLLTDVGRDTLGLFQFSFQSPTELTEVLSVSNWDIEEIKISPDESKLLFTVNEGGVSKLGIYQFDSESYDVVEDLPSGVFDSLSWIDEENFIVGVKSSVLPGDVWKVHLNTKETERLTYVGDSKSVSHLWMEPELCSFASFDGLEVPYFLYGKKEKSQPVVIYVHGGPESQIRSVFNPVIQYLAAKGFAVAAPNVRGSMGYGRKYVQLDDVRKRMDSVADLKWLVEDLVQTHHVDREKVGIMGRSYGGFMVLAAVTHYPDLWAAGVDIVGISHFKSFLENTGPWRRKLRESEYGSLEKDVDFFEEIAPLNHTDKITAPLLVFHGRNDVRVPVSEAEQLTADLKEQGKEVELIIFEDEGHQTERIENHITMNSKIVEFFKKCL
ncbi:Dipeptidyl aminopeptidase/acylaminoacyl peptidase [Oceanobacillus limi]|uniref:Dipeptidyl aminopeptidase/acylaminoacyl peptidase n=1 Tax=Oceanobacillus limi TaxID=930131 RepID=A0A1I0AHY3_9BACI|nr:alpha/beta fold hydrolase [Oceanobacillus limi]SES93303.1 Dipeptidyl aminopeptidase/acylaminoacyl peptidase [Oceanobacillus limi]